MPDDLSGFGRFHNPALLILVSLADGRKHGYTMMEDIARLAGVRIGPGTLYAALARLERRGLIEGLPSDDRRRPYRLTDEGRRALAAGLADLERLARAARARLETAGPPGNRGPARARGGSGREPPRPRLGKAVAGVRPSRFWRRACLFVLRLYPRAWRGWYGDEVAALLESSICTPRAALAAPLGMWGSTMTVNWALAMAGMTSSAAAAAAGVGRALASLRRGRGA